LAPKLLAIKKNTKNLLLGMGIEDGEEIQGCFFAYGIGFIKVVDSLMSLAAGRFNFPCLISSSMT